MYGMLPTRQLSTTLFLMFTLDILYIPHSFPFAMRMANAAARKKKDVHTQHKYRDLAARMLNWSHETGRKHCLFAVSCDQ